MRFGQSWFWLNQMYSASKQKLEGLAELKTKIHKKLYSHETMTLCRWYCSVAFWAGKPHNNYVNVKICKMPIMRCTHSFPSSIRIGKNTKGLKNLSWMIYSGREPLTRWGCEPCRVQLKLDQNNRGRRGKLWLLLLKCFKNTFGSQKSIISFLSCIACFKTHSQPILLFNFASFEITSRG